MVLKPLWSWNVQINNVNETEDSTIHNAKQDIVDRTYVYTYSYSNSFFNYSYDTEHSWTSPSNFDYDRFEGTWTVPKGKNGYYYIYSWAEETVDHWIYINGRQFLHNQSGQRNTAHLYVYLNDRDVVRVVQNNNNNYQGYNITFRRITDAHTYEWGDHKDDNNQAYWWTATIDSPYVTGNIS